MSNTIAVVIAVIGILALFAAAGALLVVLRRSGTHPVTARPEAATGDGALSPELAAEAQIRATKEEAGQLRADLERREARLAEREGRLDDELRKLEQRAAGLETAQAALDTQRAELALLEDERRKVLERAAGLTAGQAKAELVATIENQAKREAALIVRETENQARRDGEGRARRIVTLAIQ